MGKSTALKHLSLSWAEGSVENLKQFDYVFHITPKDVKNTDTLESIIVRQHKGLSGNSVQPSEIKHLLERDAKGKVLLLLDGYDEYRRGINAHIDKVITKDLYRSCSIVLASRETEELPAVREYMDSEAKKLGFDDTRMKEYISKYLGSTEKSNDLIKAVKKAATVISSYNGTGNPVAPSNSVLEICEDTPLKMHFYDGSFLEFLRKPFLLHMVCVLYCRHSSLPKTKTGIFDAVVNRCVDCIGGSRGGVRDARPPPWASKFFRFHAVFGKIWRVHAPPGGFTPPPLGKILDPPLDWDAVRRLGRKNVENMKETLVKLGKLAMKGLLEEQPRQSFSKVLKVVKNGAVGSLVGGRQECKTQSSKAVWFTPVRIRKTSKI